MNWEYKRVLISVKETVRKKYDKHGVDRNPADADSVEDLLNMLGSEGWELVTAVNLDSGADSQMHPILNVIEYVFKRKK